MYRTALAVLALGAALSRPAMAESDWGVVLNGHAFHLHAEKHWNEDNWGLGVEKEFNSSGRWVTTAVANAFKDSMDNPSYMAGASIKRRFRARPDHFYFDAGVVGFFMTRENVNHNAPFPGALPTMTFGARYLAVNVTYMPGSAVNEVTTVNAHALDPSITGVFFIQLKLDAWVFRPRRD
jgi:antimicrobial peptide resistance and lipid A acylation protein PagP